MPPPSQGYKAAPCCPTNLRERSENVLLSIDQQVQSINRQLLSAVQQSNPQVILSKTGRDALQKDSPTGHPEAQNTGTKEVSCSEGDDDRS